MMPDRENVINELHDARRYLEDKEWSDRCASPHIDAINDALAFLKEQEKEIENLKEIIKEADYTLEIVKDKLNDLLKKTEGKE